MATRPKAGRSWLLLLLLIPFLALNLILALVLTPIFGAIGPKRGQALDVDKDNQAPAIAEEIVTTDAFFS